MCLSFPTADPPCAFNHVVHSGIRINHLACVTRRRGVWVGNSSALSGVALLPRRNGASECGLGGVVEMRRAVSCIVDTKRSVAFFNVQSDAATETLTAATG